jgi:acetone carboxylase alpha subunit
MYCIAVHYDEKAKEWNIDDEETKKLRAAKRKERLSRGIPVEGYWLKARQRLLEKKLDPLLQEAYRSSMKLSEGFTRDYKDFWALPNDFAF